MSTGTNKERITANNSIIADNNDDIDAIKTIINNLPTSGDTTATASDILSGKTAVSKGVKLTGTLGTETKTVKSSTSSQTITPTTGKLIDEINVQPILLQSKGVSISSNGTTVITPNNGYDGLSQVDVTVSGILDTSDANATASDIASGKTAYVNGVKLTGTASGGGSGLNWSAIGFGSAQTTEQPLLEGLYDMASSIYNNWDVDNSSIGGAVDDATSYNRPELIIFPGVTMSDNNFYKDCTAVFQNCTNLLEIGELDFTIDNSTQEMFDGCTNLRYIPVLDTSAVTSMYYMFNDCMSLTNACLDNIATMCINAVNEQSKSISDLFGGVSWGDYRFNYLSTNYYTELTNAGWSFI